MKAWLFLGGIVFCIFAAARDDQASPTASAAEIHSIDPSFQPLPPPPDTHAGKVALGKKLFFEKRISGNGQVSCASCHDLAMGGAGAGAFSMGVDGKDNQVNAPTVFNAALNFRQFWDGRAATLADQIDGPLNDPNEMASSWSDAVQTLNADPVYAKEFFSVFGAPASRENISQAIVEFEKTLLTPNAPFDRFLRGDVNALTTSQKRGYEKFRSYGCVACHQGVNVGGNMFQAFGVMGDYFKDRGGVFKSDLGVFKHSNNPADRHVFRVPSLRNVEKTAPYFHDGQTKTLEDAVNVMGKYQLGRKLSKEEAADIANFLRSLTGEIPASVKGDHRP